MYSRLNITPLNEFVLAPDTGRRNFTGLKMLSWVAPIYDRSLVMQVIFDALGREWTEAEYWVDDIKAQFFPQTATWSLKYWEDSLGLSRNESSTDAQRRARVLSKLLQGTSVNINKLLQTIYNVTGVVATYQANVDNYTFALSYRAVSDSTQSIIEGIIENMKPAHLSYTTDIIYNTWFDVSKGLWSAITTKTWLEVKEDEL